MTGGICPEVPRALASDETEELAEHAIGSHVAAAFVEEMA
jgi:hypothetical protein